MGSALARLAKLALIDVHQLRFFFVQISFNSYSNVSIALVYSLCLWAEVELQIDIY